VEEQRIIYPEVDCVFAMSVAAHGDRIAISCEGGFGSEIPGAVYLYQWDGVSWIEETELTAVNGATVEPIGPSLSLGNEVVAFSTHDYDENLNIAGAVYVFRNNGASWIQEARITAADGDADDVFGFATALHGNVLAATSFSDPAGAVYFFRYDGAQWDQEQKLTAAELGAPGNLAYTALDLGNNVGIVGLPYEDGVAQNTGAAYVFRNTNGIWGLEQRITSGSADPNQYYATSISIYGNALAISHTNSPSVDYFRFNGAAWVRMSTITAESTGSPLGPAPDFLGNMTAMDGAHLMFGWPLGDGAAALSGVVYASEVHDCYPIPAMSLGGSVILASSLLLVGARMVRRSMLAVRPVSNVGDPRDSGQKARR
jgi:hypothetical protein